MTIRHGTYYPARRPCAGEAAGTTQLMQAYLLKRFAGMRNGGLYLCRNIAGTDILSQHGTGNCGDTMTGTGQPTTASKYLAEQMRIFSEEIGIQGIIHNRRQFFCHRQTNWYNYPGANPHVDHIHWERIPNMPLSATEIQRLFQGPAPTGNHLFAGRVCRPGDDGSQVAYVQARLNGHGFGLTVDGRYGPKTQAAVRTFQTLAGIKVDGIAGAETQGRLQ